MKPSAATALVIAILLAATFAGLYLAQPNPQARRVQELETALSKAQAEIARLNAQPNKPLSANASVIAASATTPPAPERNLNPVTHRGPAIDSATGAPLDAAAQREAAYKYHEPYINSNYGRLIRQLALSPEETEHFKRLLADRQASLTKASTHSITATTPEQKAALSRDLTRAITEAKASADAAIKHFLNNDEDYQAYQVWEDTFLQRMQIQRAVADFDAAGETLSGEQRNQLYDLMVAQRVTPKDRPALKAQTPAQGTENYQQLRAAREQIILQQAAAFLTPGQLAALQKMQEKQRSYGQSPRPASSTGP